MKKVLIDYAAKIGITLVLCMIVAILKALFESSLIECALMWWIASYIYKDLKIGAE